MHQCFLRLAAVFRAARAGRVFSFLVTLRPNMRFVVSAAVIHPSRRRAVNSRNFWVQNGSHVNCSRPRQASRARRQYNSAVPESNTAVEPEPMSAPAPPRGQTQTDAECVAFEPRQRELRRPYPCRAQTRPAASPGASSSPLLGPLRIGQDHLADDAGRWATLASPPEVRDLAPPVRRGPGRRWAGPSAAAVRQGSRNSTEQCRQEHRRIEERLHRLIDTVLSRRDPGGHDVR